MEIAPWDVFIVSAFGRCDWLAVELETAGLSVALLDVSPQLGNWPIEDVAGPFGLFMSEKYPQSFLEYLSHLGHHAAVDSGFTVWTGQGPIEMKSPVTAYRFAQLGLNPRMRDLLSANEPLSVKDKILLEAAPFEEVWPLHLAYQLGSSTFKTKLTSLSTGRGLPLMNSFLVNQPSRDGLERSLKWVESHGIKVFKNCEIVDIAMAGRRQLTGIELKGPESGFFRFENLVSSLSSEETFFLNERLGKKLFPQGAIDCSWSWMRFRLKVENCVEVSSLPRSLCWITDVMEPWTHENLCLLEKTALPENLDAWVRLPTVQRFNKEYLTTIGQKILRNFEQKIPPSKPEILTYPQPYYYTYKELGPSRFPIYLPEDAASRESCFFKNFHRDGVEVAALFSLDDQYNFQSQLRGKIIQQWLQTQNKKKELMND